jgi:Neurotransmitter-gated ion-channel ligand binding domain/Neurotransmitter-gated ion-channel transmembrane region
MENCLSKVIFIFTCLISAAVFAQPSQTPKQVKTAVFIVDIRDIDGARQNFSGDVLIRLRWKDEKLAGDQNRFLPLSAAWHPNVQVVNRISVQTTLPEGLEVDQEGNVTYRQRFIGQFGCTMDLREFPFDQQEFSVRLVAIGFSPEKLQFVPDPDPIIVSKFSITDWKILSANKKNETYSVPGGIKLAGFTATFAAKRYFQFFFVQMVIPIALILGMSGIAFWLDHTNAGPRISISITSMLTIVAYRLLLTNFTPRLSYLTRLDFFVFSSTILVFLSLVTVVVISRIMLNQKEALAKKLDIHARWVLPVLFLSVVILCFFA